MATTRKVEIFSAGCELCEAAVKMVTDLACRSCEVSVLDMRNSDVEKRARALGIRSVPAVAVNGELVSCCAERGLEREALAEAGVGTPA